MKILKTARWLDEEPPTNLDSKRLSDLYVQRRQIEEAIKELEERLELGSTTGEYHR